LASYEDYPVLTKCQNQGRNLNASEAEKAGLGANASDECTNMVDVGLYYNDVWSYEVGSCPVGRRARGVARGRASSRVVVARRRSSLVVARLREAMRAHANTREHARKRVQPRRVCLSGGARDLKA
jgi:hypothetical protein